MMMIDLCNKLVDNDLTKKDLLEKVEIQKTKKDDLEQICKTLAKAFDLSSDAEALQQLTQSNALLDESIKLVDKENGDIYGLLMFCENPIKVGSPISFLESGLTEYLDAYTQVNGHSFIIDERLRGTHLDKKMLWHNIKFLSENYDLIWIGVERDLKTHEYWKRLGFVKVFEIPEAIFYLAPLSEKMINEYTYPFAIIFIFCFHIVFIKEVFSSFHVV